MLISKAFAKNAPFTVHLDDDIKEFWQSEAGGIFHGAKDEYTYTTVYAHPELWCGGFNNEVQIGNDVCMFI